MSSFQPSWTWVRPIESADEAPEAFRKYLAEYDCSGEPFPYAVFLPPERAFSDKVNAKVVCATDKEIHIYEKDRKKVRKTVLPIECIQYIECGSVLLSSWITLRGLAQGNPVSVTVKINTTVVSLLRPIIDKIRRVSTIEESKAGLAAVNEERAKFDYLISQNFKFMNLGQCSIAPGEKVEKILYQPEVKEKKLQLLGKAFFKTLVKNYMVVLTNKEMILIKEPEERFLRYGSINRYIPLQNVKDIAISDNNALVNIAINLTEEEKYQLELHSSMMGEIRDIFGEYIRS